MSDVIRQIIGANANTVGELLRDITFVGDADSVGCYTTFDVRPDSTEWDFERKAVWWQQHDKDLDTDPDEARDRAAAGKGYTYRLDQYRVHVVWFWDGDGTLAFQICDPNGKAVRTIINTDCKKDHRWDDIASGPAAAALDSDQLELMIERVTAALSRFVFPGCVVPRSQMAEAAVRAALHTGDLNEVLPAKQIIVTGYDRAVDRAERAAFDRAFGQAKQI